LLGQWEEAKPEVLAPEADAILDVEALLEAWDDKREEIVAEPELVKLVRAVEEDPLPVKEDRATDVEARYRYISFWMADQAYALPIAQVIESDKLAEVTPLPRVNEAIRGLIHLRGEILPMLDLRLILGSKSNEVDERMLIVRTKSSAGACGLAVDRVSGLIAIRPHEIEPCESKYVSSYCERQGSQIGLLDLDRIFEGLSNSLAVRECDV
jgi:purine-binding chemotaxis protein CheW